MPGPLVAVIARAPARGAPMHIPIEAISSSPWMAMPPTLGSSRITIWLTTTLAVTVISLVAYRSITRVPDLAGRTDPTVIWDDPTAVFADPGLLGTAVELRGAEAG